MILELLPALNARRIVLASGSPRRVELLTNLGLSFTKVPSTFPEDLDKSTFDTPADYVIENARRKAMEVYNRLTAEGGLAGSGLDGLPDVVIGSDTVVVKGTTILEKPPTTDEAHRVLMSLSGGSCDVFSGVAVVVRPWWATEGTSGAGDRVATGAGGDGELMVDTFSERSEVHFAELNDALIKAYVATGEPMDKAGGFGIQGTASCFIKGMTGCYANVIGFPVHAFCSRLKALLPAAAVAGDASDVAVADAAIATV